MAEGEVTISELELADEVLGDMVLAVDTTSDTKSVSLRQLKVWLGSSLPTGFIIPAIGRISDERFTLLDGKTLARDGSYQAFCNKVVSEVQAGNWFACSEDEYNSDISNYGQCGKFVVSNDYVRIPTITRFIGATVTLSEIGKTYKESLPNITGKAGKTTSGSIGGAFYKGESAGNADQVTNTGNVVLFNASRSSSTYKDGAKVQPDHTKYPYYMVVSTEGQTSPVEIDINQVYEDLNLKADTAYVDARTPTGTILPYGGSTAPSGFLLCNGGAISRTTYARLFAVIGETYGAGDGSTTFNLPNLIGLTSDNVPCKGNGKTLGVTDGTRKYGTVWTASADIGAGSNFWGKEVGSVVTSLGNNAINNTAIGVTTDQTKSGIVSSLSSASQKSLAIIKY